MEKEQILTVRETPHLEWGTEYRLESRKPAWDTDLGSVDFNTIRERRIRESLWIKLERRKVGCSSKKYDSARKKLKQLKELASKREERYCETVGMENYHKFFRILGTSYLVIQYYSGEVRFYDNDKEAEVHRRMSRNSEVVDLDEICQAMVCLEYFPWKGYCNFIVICDF